MSIPLLSMGLNFPAVTPQATSQSVTLQQAMAADKLQNITVMLHSAS